jgi:type II secretory pathway component PulF
VRFAVHEQIFFAKRLGMLLRSGIPILECLTILSNQSTSRGSAAVYASLCADIARGAPLSTGLEKFPKIFNTFSINIIRVGEASGTLPENLEYLSDELKKKQIMRRAIRGAMVYPILIVFATIGIALFLTMYIFPKITPIFQSIKADLPLPTRLLMSTSTFFSQYGWWLLIALITAVVVCRFLLQVASMRLLADTSMIRIPIVGHASRNYNCSNIARTLSLLLKSGVPIAQTLQLVAASTHNSAYHTVLLASRERIFKGQKLSTELAVYPHLFPALFSQMVATGEASGNLSSSLSYLATIYEEEVNDITKNLATLIEPVLMIVMGIIVGFIAISIITPLYSITEHLNPA